VCAFGFRCIDSRPRHHLPQLISLPPLRVLLASGGGFEPSPQEQAQRKKEALAERVEKLSRVRVLDAIRKKLPDVLSRPDLEMVALDHFRRLGHDNHRRLSKVYAWEEKKSKASCGAETVDFEKRVSGFVLANPESKNAAAAVQGMKAADLNRFLVVCALVSDLYCPGYNPRQSLAKDSNIARTASRYKIDVAKVGATTRIELTKKAEAKARATKRRTPSNASSRRCEPSKSKPTE